MKYITVVALALIFAVGAVLSPLAMLLMPWRAGAIFRAQNRLTGVAYLGFDGSRTISATCGTKLASNEDCAFCKRLCAVLHEVLEEKHCEKEAK